LVEGVIIPRSGHKPSLIKAAVDQADGVDNTVAEISGSTTASCATPESSTKSHRGWNDAPDTPLPCDPVVANLVSHGEDTTNGQFVMTWSPSLSGSTPPGVSPMSLLRSVMGHSRNGTNRVSDGSLTQETQKEPRKRGRPRGDGASSQQRVAAAAATQAAATQAAATQAAATQAAYASMFWNPMFGRAEQLGGLGLINPMMFQQMYGGMAPSAGMALANGVNSFPPLMPFPPHLPPSQHMTSSGKVCRTGVPGEQGHYVSVKEDGGASDKEGSVSSNDSTDEASNSIHIDKSRVRAVDWGLSEDWFAED